MKALVKSKAAPGLWLEEVPKPQIKPDEVLLRVKKAAVCGTDVHIYDWDAWASATIPVPLTIGHEFVGEIVEMGSGVTGLKIGQRVCSEGHIYCHNCRNCRTGKRHLCLATQEGIGIHRNGGFAEFVAIPAANAVAIPDSIPDEWAAIFDPLGNAVHTALAYEFVGEDVLITGAGPIGMMATAVCRHAGARHIVVTDVNPFRLQMAKKLGATRVVNVAQESLKGVMEELGIGCGFSVGLEMSGVPSALDQMIDTVAAGGALVLLGILPKGAPVDWPKIIFKGLTLKGIYGREMFRTWFKVIRLVESGLDLDAMITHRFPLERYEEAFATMKGGHSGKVILEIG